MLVETKKCHHCKGEFPLDRFYKNNYKKDHLSSCCKKCQNEYSVQRNKINKLVSSGEFKWTCDYGHVNILDYDPTIEKRRWDNEKCQTCLVALTDTPLD